MKRAQIHDRYTDLPDGARQRVCELLDSLTGEVIAQERISDEEQAKSAALSMRMKADELGYTLEPVPEP